MKPIDVVILTEKRYANPVETNAYIDNVLLEDKLVKEALEKEELNVKRLAWDDAYFDWNTTKYVLFRTTWDYFDRFSEFSSWLTEVGQKTILLNSAKIIHWNIDKHYLHDLSTAGIEIVPTYFMEKGDTRTLSELHTALGWEQTVLKPCVSGAARHTYKLNLDTIHKHEILYKNLISEEAMMLQPFMNQIVTKGEISLIVINGTYTHAILKKAKAGDFRVQDDFGGSVYEYNPSLAEIDFAENAVKACIELPIYARVDIIWDNDDQLAISEIELIEPELWFRHNNDAATQLAKGIVKKLETKSFTFKI
ncbi:ATP-grasp domain-containing protein [Kordia sp.]|uniref:ATP-grasp domain-containing protein n=1 Tax=Kordia sp. TaxID=1965332 RepID=UPI003D298E18